MPLSIFLNATLRRYIPDYDPYRGLSLEAAPGTPILNIIIQIGIPESEVTLIVVDGRRREPDYPLTGSERLGLFPPIGGG